jgi:hypothetical protein
MAVFVRTHWSIVWAVVMAVGLVAGCGSKEASVGAGAQGNVPDSVRQMQKEMGVPQAPGLRSQEEQDAMVEGARIAAEALQKGELPPPEQMQKLPKEQQEAIKRAVEARKGATQ